jgi:hypothetical protein
MPDPLKIDYQLPEPKPPQTTGKRVARGIGVAFCLSIGVQFLYMAITGGFYSMPGMQIDPRASAVFALIAMVFLLQAMNLLRKILRD